MTAHETVSNLYYNTDVEAIVTEASKTVLIAVLIGVGLFVLVAGWIFFDVFVRMPRRERRR